MKKLLGVDIVGSATLSPGISGVGTVTFTGPVLGLHQLLIVTNVTRNVIVYNFADPDAGEAAYSNNVLTLTADTATQSASDVLQVFVDVADPLAVEAGNQSTLNMLLVRLVNMLMAPLGYSKDLQRYRGTNIIESGTVTTVTTVTTASSLTNFGALSTERLVLNQNMAAWAATHRSRIT
jgi:hypothetical protein